MEEEEEGTFYIHTAESNNRNSSSSSHKENPSGVVISENNNNHHAATVPISTSAISLDENTIIQLTAEHSRSRRPSTIERWFINTNQDTVFSNDLDGDRNNEQQTCVVEGGGGGEEAAAATGSVSSTLVTNNQLISSTNAATKTRLSLSSEEADLILSMRAFRQQHHSEATEDDALTDRDDGKKPPVIMQHFQEQHQIDVILSQATSILVCPTHERKQQHNILETSMKGLAKSPPAYGDAPTSGIVAGLYDEQQQQYHRRQVCQSADTSQFSGLEEHTKSCSERASLPTGTIVSVPYCTSRQGASRTTPTKDIQHSELDIHMPGAYTMNGVDASGNTSSLEFSFTGNGDDSVGSGGNDHDVETQDSLPTLHSGNLNSSMVVDSIPSVSTTLIAASIVVDDASPVEAAVLSREDVEELAKPGLRKRLRLTMIALICAVLVVVAGMTIAINAVQDGSSATTNSPTVSPTQTLESRVDSMMGIITETLYDNNSTVLAMSQTAQSRAFVWLSSHDGHQTVKHDYEVIQRYVLAVLYFATDGPSWKDQQNILSALHECLWLPAITCNGSGTVTEVTLESNGLNGVIPSELFALTNLTSLSLRDNALSGTIPSQLSRLSMLLSLDLRQNEIFGTIPTELSFLTNLERLLLQKNLLHGTILPNIQAMTGLTDLDLESNDLTGLIPLDIFHLTSLKTLRLGQNVLDGPLPSEIGQLRVLQDFGINTNEIYSNIPTEIGLLSLLSNLQLPDTRLFGTIPTELGNLGKVTKLALSYCNLTGTVPTEFVRLTSLQKLYLQGNLLEGNINFMCGAPLQKMDPFRIDLSRATCRCCTCCP